MRKKDLATEDNDQDSIRKIGQFRKFLGLRLSAWIELIVFFVIMGLLALFLGRDDLFFTVCPHPFWIIVVLLSAQYGTAEGLVAALVSTIVLLLGDYPERDILQDQFAYFLFVAKNPILWFVTAVILGEVRNRHIRERDKLRTAAVEAEEKEKTIANTYNQLKSRKEHLDVRVASELQTALMSYEAFKKLEVLDKDTMLRGAVDLIKTFINPEKYSVYFLEKGQLQRYAEAGWQTGDTYQTTFTADSNLFQRVIGKGEVVSVLNSSDRETLGSEGALAVPIKSTQPLSIYGMLKIEKIAYTQMRMNTVQILRLIGEWVGTAYANYLGKQESDAARFTDSKSNLLTPSFLEYQKDFLINLGKRLHASVLLLHVVLDAKGEISEEQKLQAMQAFRKIVSATLRSVDQAFEYKKTGLEFALLLVNTSIEQCEVVKNKINGALEHELSPNFSVNYRMEPLYLYE